MPVFTEPIASKLDFNGNVTFRAKAVKNVFAVVNFVRSTPLYTHDIPASVKFQYKKDLPASVSFVRTGNLYSIPANVTFQSYAGSSFITASVTFPYRYDFPASVDFVQSGEFDTLAKVTFFKNYNLPASVHFLKLGKFSLPANVFLGQLRKDIPANVTFNQTSKTDFSATMQIRQVIVQKGFGNFNNFDDFPATIKIIGQVNINIPATVNFRRPPFDIDTLATVSFTQFSSKDTLASITIRNSALSGGGIGVAVQPVSTNLMEAFVVQNLTPSPAPVPNDNPPPIEANAINVQTDATGYFEIINLVPGNYIVIPHSPGLIFTPPSYNVTITNSNVQLYLTADGALINQIETTSTLPVNTGPNCFIDQTIGNAGTYSIEGFVLLKEKELYQNILTIATSEDSASNFRETLG